MRPISLLAAALFAAVPAVRAIEAAPPAEPAASQPISRAEQMLFLDEHLTNVKPPQSLSYLLADEDGANGRITDKATVQFTAGSHSRCCNANANVPTSSGKLDLPEVTDATANPVLMYFLEREVRELQLRTKGQAAHFRRYIRMALADNATIAPTTVRWKDSEVAATAVTIAPFVNDPFRARFEREALTEYTFVVSPAVPGSIVQMRATLPGAQPLLRRSLTLEGAVVAVTSPSK